MPKQYAACVLLAALAAAAPVAWAAEFWLLPTQFFVAPGTAVAVRALVGSAFAGAPWRGPGSRVVRFTHLAPTGLVSLPPPTAADTLQATMLLREPGTHVVALATSNAFLTLPADRFNAYLKEHGLDHLLLERQQRGALGQPGREAYRRCAATLVQVGPPPAPTDTARAWSRPLGLPLELVPEQNPYALRAGASLTVRVLADGQPQPGRLVQVWQRSPGQPVRLSKLYSNQNGRVLLRLMGAAQYMLGTVHMVPATLPEADWQSTWSTLTFGFRPARAR